MEDRGNNWGRSHHESIQEGYSDLAEEPAGDREEVGDGRKRPAAAWIAIAVRWLEEDGGRREEFCGEQRGGGMRNRTEGGGERDSSQ